MLLNPNVLFFILFQTLFIRCITRTGKKEFALFFICKMKLLRNKLFSLHLQVALFFIASQCAHGLNDLDADLYWQSHGNSRKQFFKVMLVLNT